MTLLELTCIQMKKSDPTELVFLNRGERNSLADSLERLDSDKPPLEEWNSVSLAIFGFASEGSCSGAKRELIARLRA